MKKHSISANLIRVIKHLYDKATITIPFNGTMGDWFRTTDGVRQGCLLSLSATLFQHVSGNNHDRRLTRSRRHCQHWRQNNQNLRFADDIDGLAGEEEELAKLVERLDKASTASEWRSVPRRPS